MTSSKTIALLAGLRDAIAGGLEPGLSANGGLQIALHISNDVYAGYLSVDEGMVTVNEGLHPQPRTAIRLTTNTLELFRRGHFELRDPALVAELGVRGDLGFLHDLVTSCDRPDRLTETTFRDAEQRARQNNICKADFLGGVFDRDVVLKQLRAGKPTVFSGWLTWPALKWSFNELRSRYGNCLFLPNTNNGEPLSALIDRMLAGSQTYSHGCRLPVEMKDEFKIPVFEQDEIGVLQMWMGSRSPNLVTGLHREVASPFLAQVIGRKRLVLYSPDQSELLYGRKAYRTYQQCWVNQQFPKHDQFPRFREARPLVIDLEPGQILLIPPAWYHCAYALDDVLSISTVIKPEIVYEA